MLVLLYYYFSLKKSYSKPTAKKSKVKDEAYVAPSGARRLGPPNLGPSCVMGQKGEPQLFWTFFEGNYREILRAKVSFILIASLAS